MTEPKTITLPLNTLITAEFGNGGGKHGITLRKDPDGGILAYMTCAPVGLRTPEGFAVAYLKVTQSGEGS